ncbi:MAG TPA: SDR family oxidoreductase, partial [Thermoanaerobaculia bacterium]|nr:SDR family oxidoreductase [Thermoanaerobaculia bacterium]
RVAAEVVAAGGTALPVVTDVSRWEDVDALALHAIAAFGRIDVWINNASVAVWSSAETMEPDEIRRVVEVDLLGAMYGSRAAVPHLRATGGTLINIASALADRSVPLLSTYSAAKVGVSAFSEALRMELKMSGAGVDVVVIRPSAIDTPFYSWGHSHLGVRPHPLAVIYPPEAVAKAIVAAAERPQRDIYVGLLGKLLSVAQRISPMVVDWYMLLGRRELRQQFSDVPDAGESNLFRSPDETRIHGDWTEETRRGSAYTTVVELHPGLRRGLLAAAALAGVALLLRRRG